MTNQIIKQAPERLFLQHEEDDYSGHEGQTWCEDRINDSDTEYMRKDLVSQAITQAVEEERSNFWTEILIATSDVMFDKTNKNKAILLRDRLRKYLDKLTK